MPAMILTFLFGLFGDASGEVVDEHFVRITQAEDLPDMKRTREVPGTGGARAGLYSQAKYGWRPGRCTIHGPGVADALRARLGEPLRMERLAGEQYGYMWRRKDSPNRGLLIQLDPTGRAAVLKSWRMRDKPWTNRISKPDQNRIYAWFHSLAQSD